VKNKHHLSFHHLFTQFDPIGKFTPEKNDGYFGSFWRYPMLVFTFFTPTPAKKELHSHWAPQGDLSIGEITLQAFPTFRGLLAFGDAWDGAVDGRCCCWMCQLPNPKISCLDVFF